jgi:predicted O-methyltransferase YrrM
MNPKRQAPLSSRIVRGAITVLLLVGVTSRFTEGGQSQRRVPPVPSPPEVIREIARAARFRLGLTVADLGCGDGRVVLAAAQAKARAVCVENDPEMMAEAKANAEAAGLSHAITFVEKDLREYIKDKAEVARLDVVVLYLTSEMNRAIASDLLGLREGALVISHAYAIPGWRASQVRPVWIASTRNTTRLYVYEISQKR